jgi:hypothetical protein
VLVGSRWRSGVETVVARLLLTQRSVPSLCSLEALPLGNRPRGMPAAGAATPATSDRYVPRPTTPEETAVQVSGPPATANPQGRNPCPYPWQPSEGNALPLGNRPRGMPAAGVSEQRTPEFHVQADQG